VRVLAVPVGSTEQHGPHLPLDTDTRVATALALGLAAARPSVTVGPALAYGASGEHAGFAGTLSIGSVVLEAVLVELLRSADAFAGVVLVNGHGGNDTPCKGALRELKSEFENMRDLYIVYATYWNLAAEKFNEIRSSPAGGMGHACEMETSIMLAKHPDLVDISRARRDGPGPHMGYRVNDMLKPLPFTLINEFDEISTNGVIGMPEFATPEKGEQFLEAAAQSVCSLIDEISKWNFQERSSA